MIVKICGITRREDAEAAAAMGAGALGLNFYPMSPRYISPELAAEICAGVPASVLKVGVFVNEPPAAIAQTAAAAGLDAVQIHGSGGCPGYPVWRAVSIAGRIDPSWFDDKAGGVYLLDTASAGLHGGTGKTFDWALARLAARYTVKPIVIAGGLDDRNVGAAIEQARPWGVDVCSRIESQPGRKDHVKMKRFLEAALVQNI